MNKLTIPALLLGIVMTAGAFAVMPVEEASTVHANLQETSTNYVTETATAAANNDDFTITCPANNDGCRIVEIYLDDDDVATTIDPGVVTVTLGATFGAGEAAFQTAADSGGATGGGTTEIIALTNVSNTALPATGSLRIEITPSAPTNDYQLTVIAETQANTTVTVARIAD